MRFLLPLLIALAVGVGLLGCAMPAGPLPHYQVEMPRLRNAPPIAPAAALVPDDPSAPFVLDKVRIATEQATVWKDLPTSVTNPFDRPPVDVSLRDVVAETLANNRQIKLQGYALRIAEYEIPASRGIYDLVANSTLNYSRTESESSVTSSGLDVVSRSRLRSGQAGLSQLLPTGATLEPTYSVVRSDSGPYQQRSALSLTQPLMRGFGWAVTNAPITLAQYERQGSAADFQTSIADQLDSALKTYWELVGTIEAYKVQVLAYAAALDLVRINQVKFDVDLIAISDLVQAQANAEGLRDQVIRTRQAIRNSEDQLKRLIFLQEGTPLWSAQIRPTQPIGWREVALDQERTLAVAYQQRPELRRARSDVDQSSVRLRVARNSLLPTLNLFGEVSANSISEGFDTGFRTLDKANFVGYVAGLEFSFPLQNRVARYRYRQADARQGQAGEQLLDEKDQVTQEVRDALRALRTARERIDISLAQVASEVIKLDVESQRLDVGLSTTYRVIQFQADLAQAQLDHIRAVIDYNTAGVDLERARGTILDTFGVQVIKANLNPELAAKIPR